MTQFTKARMLIGAVLLLATLNAFVWPQAKRPAKTAPAKPAAKQVTLTLVRWPYT